MGYDRNNAPGCPGFFVSMRCNDELEIFAITRLLHS